MNKENRQDTFIGNVDSSTHNVGEEPHSRIWRSSERSSGSEQPSLASPHSLSHIKAEALRLGFFACGAAKAEAVDKATADLVHGWIDTGSQADMAYMANHTDKRLDPRLLVPGTETILSLAMNYAPSQPMPENEYQFAAYAYGQDYHEVMKERMRELVATLFPQHSLPHPPSSSHAQKQSSDSRSTDSDAQIRIFCDTAPVLERYWAWKAGLGWIGKSHQLIIPRAGTMFFLGEIFLPFALDDYDSPMESRCGNCHRCIEACPTCAIKDTPGFDAEKCLSYQLIENRGELSEQAKRTMGNTIYGCDRCQTACPWNRFATPNTEPAFQPKPELLQMKKEDWHNLTVEEYRQLFKGSAVKRAKFEGLKRNIDARKENG
ncbi:tRNA epoxyqueuosine(34) reductase QueG [Prevotella sp. HUN102]|uniref:tRNA epoxyqueuosine(34) reductase QueG n=1 Tax=Prevotella sp. HUN102 TaxID=1392486 RepID=UPI0009E0487E|nr:tRNA epoxyqueuosine(34) reductase QueG [Prevotella sp. HUN102]